jgi:hypothetical protein
MFAVRVVFFKIVEPHPTCAKTGGGDKDSAKPKRVNRSRAASSCFGGFLYVKKEENELRPDIYTYCILWILLD